MYTQCRHSVVIFRYLTDKLESSEHCSSTSLNLTFTFRCRTTNFKLFLCDCVWVLLCMYWFCIMNWYPISHTMVKSKNGREKQLQTNLVHRNIFRNMVMGHICIKKSTYTKKPNSEEIQNWKSGIKWQNKKL